MQGVHKKLWPWLLLASAPILMPRINAAPVSARGYNVLDDCIMTSGDVIAAECPGLAPKIAELQFFIAHHTRVRRPAGLVFTGEIINHDALELVGLVNHVMRNPERMFDALYPPGLQWYWRADFVNEISDDAIVQHIRFGETLPTMHSTMHMYPINGAAARVGKNETAWNYRDAMWAQVIVGVDPDPANKEKIVSWTKSYYDAVHPFSAGGAYVNFLMGDEGEERVKKT